MKHLEDAVARIVGARPVEWTPRSGGYSTAERYTVTFDDRRRLFVKSSDAANMAESLRREHEVYASLRGSFMPELVGFEDGAQPVLVIEDLSDADWSAHWPQERIAAVRATLAELSACDPPPNTCPIREVFSAFFGRWRDVERDPEPFLSLGLRSRGWLDEHLATLIAAADDVPVEGVGLLHLDVRSDNLCTVGDRVVLVDWNWAATGNPDVDVAGWAPSLYLEGGPPPWETLSRAGELAAWLAGVWAAVAGLPPPDTAPTVRAAQARSLAVALDWVDRELL